MADWDSTLGKYERLCSGCGVKFGFGTGRGQARRYCEPSCIPRPKRPTKLCDVAGCKNTARSNQSPYCERHYYQVRRTGGLLAETEKCYSCMHCGVETNGRKFCSQRCRTRWHRGLPTMAKCDGCSQWFVPVDGARTCSGKCRLNRDRKVATAYYAKRVATDASFVADVRAREYARRARKRSAFIEHVERDVVMERDKWRCHLCGEGIPKSATWPNPRFGTVDHVLPLSCGGAHSYANVKAAHLSCNCRKGARPAGQLGLSFAGT